jgi:uncharacterized lipoprotein YmbA
VNPEENKVTKEFLLRLAVISLGAMLMFTSGCGRTRPAKFYTLSPIDSSAEVESRSENTEQGVALGIGPVSFPDYLDRPQIATRNGRNALTFAEFHRWAGSLSEDFSRILSENLSILLATDRIALFPWKHATPIEYRVPINVLHFEGKSGGDVTLKVRWSILGSGSETNLLIKMSTFTESAEGSTYEAMAAAQSRALASLSREIAEAIATISRQDRK